MEFPKQRPKKGRPKGSVNKKPPTEKKRKRTAYEMEANFLKRQANYKPVETLQSIDFGESADGNQCFRASVITIKDDPYFGFIKCWRGPSRASFCYTRQRLFMPMSAWMHFMNDVLPLMKFTPPERYH